MFAALSVRFPLAVTLKAPAPTFTPARSKSPDVSFTVRLVAVPATDANWLLASRTALPVTASVTAPAVFAALSVRFPLAVTLKAPAPTFTPARSKAFLSTTVRFAAVLWIELKSLSTFESVILPVADNVAAPATSMLSGPTVCVIAPPSAVTDSAPLAVTSPSTIPFLSASVTFTPDAFTAPWKSFAPSAKTMFLAAVKVETPVTVMVADCKMSPPPVAVTFNAPTYVPASV